MKKVLVILCLAWLVHFHGGEVLKVDSLEWNTLPQLSFKATKDNRTIYVSWYNVLYIEEVK